MNTAERSIRRAHYGLNFARAMCRSGRYPYALYCCQQAAEHAIRAVIMRRTDEHPPRIHALGRLAEAAQLDLTDGRAEFLSDLSSYYVFNDENMQFFQDLSRYSIQSPYWEEVSTLATGVTKERAHLIIEQTEEIVQWLLSTT